MMLTTPVASQSKAFPLAGILNRLSLSESHTKHRNSPSLPAHRNLLIKLNCAEMELANSLILAQTCRAGSRVNKDEQYSGSAEHKHCLGSVVIRNGCNNENQQVTGKEKGGTENTALCGYGFFHHELNQHLAARQDLQLVRNYSQNPHMLNDYSNLSHEENQHLAEQHVSTCETFVGQPFGFYFKLNEVLTLSLEFGSWFTLISPESSPFVNQYSNITNITIITDCPLVGISIVKPPLNTQPFCSIPRDCNSFRIMRFIQAETDASPSCAKACLIPSSNAGSTRKAICLLPLPFISMVDIWLTPNYVWLVVKCMTSAYQKATPQSARTLLRRLTTNDRLDIEAAMLNHTPTRFKFLFLAVHRSDLNAKPHRESVTAHSEQEARRSLSGQFVLSFAGRLPEVIHA
ncbi:host cell division inhibitor Icd-like protein [Yersinia sp. 2540 StPb PI]|uniref:host cell division inhibitor Icd-like protein n=1 Tax=Yersinia sp. 2540 StPb PI TaxID=3117406 RepID=UPI003FA4C4B8